MAARRYSLSSSLTPTSPLGLSDHFDLTTLRQHHYQQPQQQQLKVTLWRGTEPTLRHLDQELSVLGLPSLLTPVESRAGASAGLDLDVNALTTACQQLVTLYHRSREAREALEDRGRRLESELRDARRAEHRLLEAAKEAAGHSAGQRERERRLDDRNRRLTDQLREAREESKRLGQQIQQRDTQHRHERRKLSKEAERLRERLQAGMSASVGPLKLSCIEVLNQLPRPEGRRAAWARVSSASTAAAVGPLSRLTASDDRAHYSSLLMQSDQGQMPRFQRNYQTQLESRQAELAAENQELRDSLFRVHRQLRELQLLALPANSMKSTAPAAEQDENAPTIVPDAGEISRRGNDDEADEELHDGLLKLPYQLVKDRLDRQLKVACDRLRSRLAQMTSGFASNGVADVNAPFGRSTAESDCENTPLMTEQVRQLKERLSSYEDIIHKQEQLIKRSLAASAGN